MIQPAPLPPGQTRRINRVEVTTACETGATHRQRQRGSEDAVGWSGVGEGSVVATVAIADGHSDRRCVRSRTGAGFVVAAATAIPAAATETGAMATALVNGWRRRVDVHLDTFPLTAADLGSTDASIAAERSAAWGANARLAYGSTALICRVTTDSISVVRIGDGDVIAVGADGGAHRLAVPERQAGELTESISQPDAERVAHCAQIPAAAAPVLLVLATDGFDNAYPARESMLRAAGELATLRRDTGQPLASDVLSRWAREAADVSGDDATIAAIWIETAQ